MKINGRFSKHSKNFLSFLSCRPSIPLPSHIYGKVLQVKQETVQMKQPVTSISGSSSLLSSLLSSSQAQNLNSATVSFEEVKYKHGI